MPANKVSIKSYVNDLLMYIFIDRLGLGLANDEGEKNARLPAPKLGRIVQK